MCWCTFELRHQILSKVWFKNINSGTGTYTIASFTNVMADLYKRFIRVLQKWPVDSERTSRYLQEYLRDYAKQAFNKRGEYCGDIKECERRTESLERISRNHWAQKYPRSRQSSALGLTAQQCRSILSTEAQQIMLDYEKPFVTRIIEKFSGGKNLEEQTKSS